MKRHQSLRTVLFICTIAFLLIPSLGSAVIYTSTDVPKAIPDNNPAGVSSTLTIPAAACIVSDINVSVQATHTWVGDLIFTLTHNNSGKSVTIIDRPGVPTSAFGCSGDNINATLDDEAGSPVETQCNTVTPPAINGTFSPNNLLSRFDIDSAEGTWTLTVSDNAGGDTGNLTGWSIDVSCLVPECTPEGTTVSTAIDGTEATQTGRMTRNGIPSSCDSAKSYPGLFGATPNYYRPFAYRNCSAQPECVTVHVDGGAMGVNVFVPAYLDGFDPSTLSGNYLADSGSSGTITYSFMVPAGQNYLLVPHTVNGTASTLGGFSFRFGETKQVCPSACTYSTVQSAINTLGLGDTIKVAQGEYDENMTVSSASDFTLSCGWDSSFTTQTRNPLLTTFSGDVTGDGLADGPVLAMSAPAANTISTVIDNCTFANGAGYYGGGLSLASSGILNVRVKNSAVKENLGYYGGGISAMALSGGVISLILTNNIIAGNVSDFVGGGIFAYAETGGNTTVSGTNNTVTDNTAPVGGGILHWAQGGLVSTTAVNDIYWGNTATVNGNDIYTYQPSGTAQMIASYSDIGEVVNDSVFPGAYYDNGFNLNTDPIFIDPALFNYRLNSDSPLRDAGTATAVTTDFEGEARPQDAGWDIGADEYVDPALPGLKILGLNGTEGIPVGAPYNITWWAPSNAKSFKIKMSSNKGLSWKTLGTVSDTRHFTWDVPLSKNNKKKCLIKVIAYDASAVKIGSDTSDATFTAEVIRVTWPNGGEQITGGTPYYITWKTNTTLSTVQTVKYFYSKDGGITWKLIDTITGSNPGEASWNPPVVTAPKTKYKVKVALYDSLGGKLGIDTSNAVFTVNP